MVSVEIKDGAIFVLWLEPTRVLFKYSENQFVTFSIDGTCPFSAHVQLPYLRPNLRLARITSDHVNWNIENMQVNGLRPEG